MSDCLTFLTEPLFSMVDLALDRPLAAIVAASGFAILLWGAVLAAR